MFQFFISTSKASSFYLLAYFNTKLVLEYLTEKLFVPIIFIFLKANQNQNQT